MTHSRKSLPVLVALALSALLLGIVSLSPVHAASPEKNTAVSHIAPPPPLALAPLLAPSQTITVTKTDAFPGADAEPGETITYTIVVSNSGAADATGVVLNDTIDQYTSYIPGALQVTPLAVADAYEAIGNTRITITATNGLLANDIDPDDPAPNPGFNEGLTVTDFDTNSANGGEVSVNGDGGFTYDPPAGFTGSDSFGYTISDGDGLTAAATATVTVSEMIWYIDNTAPSGGDGRSQTPFNSLSAGYGDADDILFFYAGAAAYNAEMTLPPGQQLIGQDFGPDDFATVTGLTRPLGTTFPAPGSGPTLTSGGDAVTLSDGNTIRGLTLGTTGGVGLTGTNFGTLTVRDVTINGQGTTLDLDSGTLDAAFDELTTTGSGFPGLSLTNVDGSLTATSGSLSGTLDTAFDVNGGTATINYPGAVSQSAAARIVQVQNRPAGAGTITLSGNLTCNASCTGLNVANNSGGTVTFSGGSKVLNTGGNTAVSLSSNTGATINFTGGGLDIAAASGAGFSAADGGTVNVTGNGNHINTTTGAGVSIVNTTIGASGVTFQSISVNGAANGIALDTTGAGAFTVTGDTATGAGISANNDSGGVILNTTGDGVSLTNASNISLDQMRIQDAADHGINASSVTNLTVTRSNLLSNGTANQEHGLYMQNGSGDLIVTNTLADSNFDTHLRVFNETVDLNLFQVDDSVLRNVTTGSFEDGITFELRPGRSGSIEVTNSTFSNHDGDHIQATSNGSANMTVTITGNSMTGTASNLGAGITVNSAESFSGSTSFTIANNDIQKANGNSTSINVNIGSSTDTGSYNGTISSNTIGAPGVADSAGDTGIAVEVNRDATMTVAITDNNVYEFDNLGIDAGAVDAISGPGALNVTATGNAVISSDANVFAAVFVDAATTNTICADIGGSTTALENSMSAPNGFADIAFRTSGSGTINLEGYGGAADDQSQIQSYIQGRNSGSPGVLLSASGGPIQGGSGCATPNIILSSVSGTPSIDGAHHLRLPAAAPLVQPGVMTSLSLAKTKEIFLVTSNNRLWMSGNQVSLASRPMIMAKSLAMPMTAAPQATPGDTITLLGDPFTLAAGHTFTVTFAVAITTALPGDVDSVQNQATVSGSNFGDVLSVDPAPNPGFPPAAGETITPLTLPADLAISKDDGQATAVPGAPITYTIVVSNNGPYAANGAAVSDVFPAALSGVAWTCAAGPGVSCTASGSGDLNDSVDLAAGGRLTYTVSAAIDSAATGTLANTASVGGASANPDPVPGNNSATDSDTLTPQVDITLSKTESVDPVVAGAGTGNLTYVVTAVNNGPSDASNVQVSETITIPAGVSLDAVAPSGGSWLSPTWTIPDLNAGDSETLSLVFTVAAGAAAGTDVIADTATVSGADQTLINTGDDSVTEATSIARQVDLAVSISESADPVTAGSGAGNLSYVVTVSNNGPSHATGVVLSDTLTLPAGVSLDAVTPSGATTWDGSDAWTVGDLAAGDSETLTLLLTVGPTTLPGTDVIANQAAITAVNETETNSNNDSASETTTAATAADLVATKVDSPDPVAAGALLTYTITISNNGPSQARDVVASDVLGADLTLQRSSGCAEDPGGAPACSLGTIPAGGAARYTLTVLVDSDIPPPPSSDTGTVTNTVTVTAATPEAAPGDETDSIDTAVAIVADLALGKVAFPDPVVAGRALTYTLTVTNHGPSQGWGVFVNDDMPDAFIYTGNSCGVFYTPPGPFQWTINGIAAGAVRTCLVTGVVDAGFSGVITNRASVGYINFVDDPNLDNNTVEEPTTVVDAALSISDVTLAEGDSGAGAFTFTISRTNTSSAVAVDYATRDGTAVAGADYTAVPTTTLNFSAGGDLTQTVAISVTGDTLDENDETFFVVLANPVNAAIDDGQGVGTILDDDAPPQLSIDDPTAGEGDGAITFTVSLDAVSGLDVDVAYATTAATATEGDDYSGVSGALTIPAGDAAGALVVPLLDDALDEAAETFTMTLSSPTNAALGDGAGLGTIIDDDPPPALSVSDVTVDEGAGTAVFTITLDAASSRDVSVAYTTNNGTAIAPADYTAANGTLLLPAGTLSETVSVSINDDALDENSETFTLTLSDPVNAAIGDGTGLGAILDNDASPSLAVDDVTVDEGGGTAVFTVTLDAISGREVSVDYATSPGSALAGQDYTPLNDTLTLAAGTVTGTIAVPIIDDILDEDDESFTVTLSNPANAAIADGAGVGVIVDNDTAVVDFSAAAYDAGEGDGAATITVSLSAPAAFTITADYASSEGTATAGVDYTAVSGAIQFPPGEITQTLLLPILDDALDETDETVRITLSDVTGGAPGTENNPATVTIRDDDATTLNFSAFAYTATEGDGAATITVTLNAPSALTVTVDYASSEGTATAGADYTAVSGALTIPAGQTTATFTVPLLDDALAEGDETIILTLHNPVNAAIGATQPATLTIQDDETLVFLPAVFKNASFLPDLVVQELGVNPDGVTVVIANQGNAPTAAPFWVDVYLDPDPAPTAVNQTWPMLSDAGLAWGVTAPLAPGDLLTLTVGGPYYRPDASSFSGLIPAGAPVYAQVDSANAGVPYGAVLEVHEAAGDPYNNIVGPVAAPTLVLLAAEQRGGGETAPLPERPR